MMLPCAGGGDTYAVEQDQPSWQTIAVADAIDAILDTAVGSDGGIVPANENVAGDGDTDIIIGDAGNDALQGEGGVVAQLIAAEYQPAVSLEWIRIAAGEQVSHSMLRDDIRARVVRVPVGSGQPHAPVEPALAPLSVLGQRSPQLQLRRGDVDPGQQALTRPDHSSPVRPDAGGSMAVTTQENGISPVAAVLGLILAFATPIALVATQIPVVDKAAVIDTASDLIAETEWYVPAQHTVSTSSLPGPVASTTSVSLTALF